MALFISSLNSGSNGNCYYVGNGQEAVLVDAGISCRETETRMKRLGLCMSTVKAIFVSHEHTDHVRGIPVLAQKYNLPVYITPGTLRGCRFRLPKHLIHNFSSHVPVSIGGLAVTAFPKLHDASEPHSFVVGYNEITVGVFTDIGAPCEQLTYHFRQCHAAFLESNYDEEMLEKGRYPYYLKTRIRGGYGHLSNTQAVEFFTTHRPTHMSHLILAHLSQDNNCPKLVHQLFRQQAGGVEVIVASRHEETAVYTIKGSAEPIERGTVPITPPRPVQASLFE